MSQKKVKLSINLRWRIIFLCLFFVLILILPLFIHDKIDWAIALTYATIFLGIIALFQNWIRKWIWKPQLTCSINLDGEDCHLAEGRLENGQLVDVYYFRFRIGNKGSESALKVEVIISDLKDDKGERSEGSFVMENLVWDNLDSKGQKRMYWDYIAPDTFHYCNLGHILDPQYKQSVRYEWKAQHGIGPLTDKSFSFDLVWVTNQMRHLLKSGAYTFKITVSALNAKTLRKNYRLSFSSDWSRDESIMFSKLISIIEI